MLSRMASPCICSGTSVLSRINTLIHFFRLRYKYAECVGRSFSFITLMKYPTIRIMKGFVFVLTACVLLAGVNSAKLRKLD